MSKLVVWTGGIKTNFLLCFHLLCPVVDRLECMGYVRKWTGLINASYNHIETLLLYASCHHNLPLNHSVMWKKANIKYFLYIKLLCLSSEDPLGQLPVSRVGDWGCVCSNINTEDAYSYKATFFTVLYISKTRREHKTGIKHKWTPLQKRQA